MDAERHRELMSSAIQRDGDAQRRLLAGDQHGAATAFAEASALYRQSWEAAPPASYGRLVGMLKSAVLAGDADAAARYTREALGEEGAGSPTASYAQAIAALILGDYEVAATWAARMHGGSEAFDRTATAIASLARGDRRGYAAAVEAIAADFAGRANHLTGVAIADTALMLERLAAARGLDAGLSDRLLSSAPPAG